MQINGTVISYTAATKIQKVGGGSYDAWELVYRSPENEVKQLAKPVQSLKFNKPLAGALAALKPNDEFTAELEKNAAGFWEVRNISKGSAVSSDQAPASSGAASSTAVSSGASATTSERPQAPQRAVNRVTGSTYETAEERAKKQVVIVRQSCIGYAVEMLSAKDRSLVNVINLAEELETWVHTDVSVAAKAYMDIKLNEEVPGGN